MSKMKKLLALLLALTMLLSLTVTAVADGDKWHEEETDDGWNKVINEGGKTLGYSPDSGVSLIEEDGYAFKDLNRDGALQPYEDWRLDNETRARDLADRLSVEEMTPLFTHGGWMSFGTEIEGSDLEYIEGGGRGGVTRSAANVGNTGMAVDWINALQALCEATGSWGIPATVSVDPCNISNTIDQLALGATFDVDTAFALGVAHGKMYRAVGITMLLGPQIDLATTPVLARTAGTYTEDPALSRDLADAYISGLQSTWAEDGTDLGWGVDSVYAIAKHYVGAGAAEGGRNDHGDSGKFDVFKKADNLAAHLIPFFDGAFNLTKSSTHESGVMPNYAISYARNNALGELVGGAYSEYKIGLLRENNYQGFILTDWGITTDGSQPFGVEDLTESERFARLYMNGIHQVGGTSDLDAAAEGFELVQDELGDDEALEILRNAAYHFLLTQFQCSLYENPYVELENALAVNYNDETDAFSLKMQEKSIIMLKNSGNTVHQAESDAEKLTVYVPYVFSAGSPDYMASSGAATAAGWNPAMDLETVARYYNVVTDTVGEPSGEPGEDGKPTYTENDIVRAPAEELAACDLALVPMTAPATDGSIDGTDAYLSEDPYLPASIQYEEYTAAKARRESLAADTKLVTKNDGYGVVTETVKIDRNYAGQTVGRASNYSDLEMLQYVKEAVPETCKVAVLMEASRPMIWSEVEPLADVILLSYSGAGFNGKWFFTEALLNVLSGQVEPSGLLNYQQPISMEEVEKQQEDLPRDCACYVDTDGNTYDFAFGLNWSGVIDDARTQTYKVDPLTKLASFKFHKAETKKNTEKAETAAAATETPAVEDTTVPAATEVEEAPAPNNAETANAEPETAAPAETEAEPDDAGTNAQGSKLVDVLMNVLAPVFNSMGAETSQVRPYLEKCVPHITALLIALGVMIVLLIAAHWLAKKGSRHVIRWSAVLAFVLALVMIVNLICYGPMKSIVSGVLNASKAEISEEVALGSRSVIQQVGEEGMVLVKNEGLLPLSSDTTKLNLFGWASVHPVFSGTGSAASGDAGKPVDILESLSMAGYATNDELSKLYADYWTALYSGTQFPTEVLMAQTWNKELARDIGAAVGQEFADANNFGWYGPAMNLHRSAFSGRNFEYFSEDAVLSGRFASEEVNGAAKLGVYAYIKHFAANDQETNRLAFLTTWMTEQCFRENCLKPFEIVVKNFDFDHYALGVMTSYNWLGLIPVISNHELLTDVLRGEWGFKGVVISDYNGGYGYQITDAAIRAGNDLMLGYGVSTGTALTDTSAATCVLAMRQACKNILYTVGNSGYYAEAAAAAHEQRDQAAAAAAAAGQSSLSKMDKLFIGVDVATGVVVLGLEALVLLRWLKKRKTSAK